MKQIDPAALYLLAYVQVGLSASGLRPLTWPLFGARRTIRYRPKSPACQKSALFIPFTSWNEGDEL